MMKLGYSLSCNKRSNNVMQNRNASRWICCIYLASLDISSSKTLIDFFACPFVNPNFLVFPIIKPLVFIMVFARRVLLLLLLSLLKRPDLISHGLHGR